MSAAECYHLVVLFCYMLDILRMGLVVGLQAGAGRVAGPQDCIVLPLYACAWTTIYIQYRYVCCCGNESALASVFID
jgi:hypothetical protein